MLVVDDEPSIRLLCRVNLELEGHRVHEAATLGEARDVLERDEIDVLLLDVHVGGEDGWALLRELRDREAGVRVCLLTGSVDIAPEDEAKADATLGKPFTLEELLTTVHGLAEVRSHM